MELQSRVDSAMVGAAAAGTVAGHSGRGGESQREARGYVPDKMDASDVSWTDGRGGGAGIVLASFRASDALRYVLLVR